MAVSSLGLVQAYHALILQQGLRPRTPGFVFQPSVERSRIEALATGAWMKQKCIIRIEALGFIGSFTLAL